MNWSKRLFRKKATTEIDLTRTTSARQAASIIIEDPRWRLDPSRNLTLPPKPVGPPNTEVRKGGGSRPARPVDPVPDLATLAVGIAIGESLSTPDVPSDPTPATDFTGGGGDFGGGGADGSW